MAAGPVSRYARAGLLSSRILTSAAVTSRRGSRLSSLPDLVLATAPPLATGLAIEVSENLAQSVFGRLAGYEGVNDADRLAHDPAMRAIVDRGGLDRAAASTSQMGRFETASLRDRLVKIVRHGRSITFQMAEVMAPRGLFEKILSIIAAPRPLPPARC